MNLSNIIKPHAEQNPDETAIIFEEHRITYGELDRLINRVAGGLLELGLKRGDVLSIFLPSLPELIVGERPIRIGRRPRRGSVPSALHIRHYRLAQGRYGNPSQCLAQCNPFR